MAHHVRTRLYDSQNLAPTVARLRRSSRSWLTFGARYGLILFGFGGDHGHGTLLCDRPTAGKYVRAAEGALTRIFRFRPGHRPGHIARVEGPLHLAGLVDYTLGQPHKHGVVGDLLLEGTNLLDLLSIRQIDTSCAQLLKAAVPSVTREQLAAHIGGYPSPGTDPTRLSDAALVVTAGVGLHSRTQLGTRARRSAARLSRSLNVGYYGTAELLGVSPDVVDRAMRESDPEMDRAMSLALGLVQRRAPDGFPESIDLPEVVTWRRQGRPAAGR